jgi:hypothetical protein
VSEEQEMQFADPAWQPKVTREFEAIAPMPAPTGVPNSGANAATTPQAGEALYDNYAQGYRAQSASTAGPESPSQGQPFQEQEAPAQNQRPPHQGPSPFQGQQAPFGQQQSPTFQSLQDQLKRLPRWVWWVAGIVILSSIVQPAADQGGPIGALFGLVFIGLLAFIGWLLWTRRVRVSLSGETRETETHTFTVGVQPTLILKNKAGSINLRAGQ